MLQKQRQADVEWWILQAHGCCVLEVTGTQGRGAMLQKRFSNFCSGGASMAGGTGWVGARGREVSEGPGWGGVCPHSCSSQVSREHTWEGTG